MTNRPGKHTRGIHTYTHIPNINLKRRKTTPFRITNKPNRPTIQFFKTITNWVPDFHTKTIQTIHPTFSSIQKDKQNISLCCISKADYNVLKQTLNENNNDNHTIIRHLDSTQTHYPQSHILFYLIKDNTKYNLPSTLINFNTINNQYFTTIGEFYDNKTQRIRKRPPLLDTEKEKEREQNKKRKQLPPQSIWFNHNDFHHNLSITSTLITPTTINTLNTIIQQFERITTNPKTEETKTAILRVFILIQGTKQQTSKFLKQFSTETQTILKPRIIEYKNLQQYQNILDHRHITHILDHRAHFIKKSFVTNHIFRNCIHITKPTNNYNKNTLPQRIHHTSTIEEAIQFLIDIQTNTTTKIESISQRNFIPHIKQTTRLITWNTNSLRNVHKLGHLIQFLIEENPDILGITELRGLGKDILQLHPTTRLKYKYVTKQYLY